MKPSMYTIDGFEKVEAACFFMREVDGHYENIGIATNEFGERHAVKIDHGRSGWDLIIPKSEHILMNEFVTNRSMLGLDKISFKSDKFKAGVFFIDRFSMQSAY